MKKVIRLTEAKLVEMIQNIISEQKNKNTINEQESNSRAETLYGQAVLKALGPNFHFSSNKTKGMDIDIPGTYEGYTIQKLTSVIISGDAASLQFSAVGLTNDYKRKDVTITFDISFSNGVAQRIYGSIVFDKNNHYTLNNKEIEKAFLPKIKGVKLNMTSTVNVNCLKNAGFTKIGYKGGINQRGEKVSSNMESYQGNISGIKAIVSSDGKFSMYDDKKDALSTGKWKCENGKFVTYNVVNKKAPKLPF